MVDNLIRQQKDKLEAASDEARLRLREWDMPEALQVSLRPPFLPSSLPLLFHTTSCCVAAVSCGLLLLLCVT